MLAHRHLRAALLEPRGPFYMVFVGPSNQFNQLQGAFDQMLRSLRFQR